jgi:hypothetical protein
MKILATLFPDLILMAARGRECQQDIIVVHRAEEVVILVEYLHFKDTAFKLR